VAKGRPPDPARAKRETGHRDLVGQRKPVEVLPALPLALDPPATIPDEAHELWTRAVTELQPRGLNAGDLPLVEMLVMAAHRNRQARAVVDRLGVLYRGDKGAAVNPMLRIEKETAATYLRLAETLGLSPAARVRLGLMQIAGQSLLVNIAKQVREAQRR